MDPGNLKALYFRSQALIKVEDFEQAVSCLNQMLEKDPEHKDAKVMLVKAKKQRQEYRDREAKKFAQMFK